MTTSSTFVTAETDATNWSNLEPLYRSLIERLGLRRCALPSSAAISLLLASTPRAQPSRSPLLAITH